MLINNYYIQSNDGFVWCLVPLLVLFRKVEEPVKLYSTLQELLAQRVADDQFRPLLIPPRYYELLIGVQDANGNALDQVVVLHEQSSDAARKFYLHSWNTLQDRLMSHRVHVAFDPFAHQLTIWVAHHRVVLDS